MSESILEPHQVKRFINISLVRGSVKPPVDFGEAWKWAVNSLSVVSLLAEELGVTILMEPEPL